MSDSDAAAAAVSSDKERRKMLIDDELQKIIKASHTYVQDYLEEDEFEEEAITALTKAVNELAYRKKFYDVMKDEMIFFPSVPKLIMKNDLQERAEQYYYDEEDEFPMEYSKCLKMVVRELGYKEAALDTEDDENADNDAYMEKLAQDVEI